MILATVLSIKTLHIIREDFFRGKYQTERPRYKRFEDDSIIDETQSSEWNKQKVHELNEQNKKDLREYRETCDTLYKKMKQEILEALQSSYSFNEQQAKLIYDFCHNEWQGEMADMFYFLEEISFLIKTFNKGEI